jgi:hypothetical protein
VFDAADTREVDIAPLPSEAAAVSTLGTATYVTRPPSSGPGLLPVESWPGAEAASGSRLVARVGGRPSLLFNAGRPTQSLRRADVPVQVPGEDFATYSVLASSPEGIVVSAVPVLGGPMEDGGKAIVAVRLVWLLRDDLDTSFAAPQRVDVVTYDPPLSTKQLDGPLGTVAVVDYARAFIAIPDPADPARSRGFVATRATTPPSLVAGREAGFPYPASRLVATSVEGVVYLVALRGAAGVDVFTLGASCGG